MNFFLLVSLAFLCHCSLSAADLDEIFALSEGWDNAVRGATLTPHWLPDGESFWYRRLTSEGNEEYILVHGPTGKKTKAPSREKLSLPSPPPQRSSAAQPWTRERSPKSSEAISVSFTNEMETPLRYYWIDYKGRRKPYGTIELGQTKTIHTFHHHRWEFENSISHKLIAGFAAENDGDTFILDGPPPVILKAQTPKVSPDGQWIVNLSPRQVSLQHRLGQETITYECELPKKAAFMGTVSWSPDSTAFIVPAVVEATERKITFIDSSPPDSLHPIAREIDYAKPGDPLPKAVPVLFRIDETSARPVPDTLFPNPFQRTSDLRGHWAEDGSEFYFNYNQRGHQLYRIIAVNAATGSARVVLEESSKTFIDYNQLTSHWLPKTNELIWKSERSGWKHLWFIDVVQGKPKHAITQGDWVVRQVLRVDEEAQQIWFMASGLKPHEDPYQQHLCRVNFDGSGWIQLTQGDGEHEIQFSPNQRYFLDTWSRADLPPTHEWRLSLDGSKITEIDRVDISQLLATRWQLPERFVAKGRDGKTDIHGILIRPSHFDPTKQYPVLEEVYAGPHSAYAPKSFSLLTRQHRFAELGMIVVQADGMGTNHRGKVFHDVAWKNLKDAGFPDRIAWIRAAAATRPWMDLHRVGIYGSSAGGQNAMRALLDHHDFYHVAAADCGCHDNRMDKIWWNELWMGWPVDESYVRSSNVEDAHKLQGQLLLTVGELDSNVDPATTLQVVGALQKAGKSFEFMPIVGAGHGATSSPYGSRLRMEFFRKHLLSPQP